MSKYLKAGGPVRTVFDVAPGDYVKLGPDWHEIDMLEWVDGRWSIRTSTGRTVGAWQVARFAKAEDLGGDD